MTTTAYDNITVESESGGAGDSIWTTSSSLVTSTTNTSYSYAYAYDYTKTLTLSTPEFTIPSNAKFSEMALKMEMYKNNSYGWYRLRVTQNSTTRFTEFRDTSSAEFTLSGDKSYWGLSGDETDIATQLMDGSIKFTFAGYNGINYAQFFHLDNFQIQLTYTTPDTKRASVIAVIP